jgi:hypothetical protein
MSYISRQHQAIVDDSIWQPIINAWLNMPADGETEVILSDIVPFGFPAAETPHGLPSCWVWRRV